MDIRACFSLFLVLLWSEAADHEKIWIFTAFIEKICAVLYLAHIFCLVVVKKNSLKNSSPFPLLRTEKLSPS